MTKTKDQGPPISPTLAKVLDKFLEVLQVDDVIEDAVAARLDELLRSGKTPKPEDISAALFPQPDDEEDGAEGDGA